MISGHGPFRPLQAVKERPRRGCMPENGEQTGEARRPWTLTLSVPENQRITGRPEAAIASKDWVLRAIRGYYRR